MPSQNPPSQAYGPFTDVLTGPLSGQRQQAMQQPSGWGGQGAALANYANAFIKSAQVGQREKYERSEAEKAAAERNFDSVFEHIQSSPNISPEAKKQAEGLYLQTKFSQVANHAGESEKEHKNHPLLQLTKAITGAVLGPGENKQHKNMGADINQLLVFATDPQYRINPQQMAAEAGGEIAGVLRGAAAEQPGIAAGAGLPAVTNRQIAVPAMGATAFSPDDAVQYESPTNVATTPQTPATITGGGRPLAAQAQGESTPGKQLTYAEAMADPRIQARLIQLQQSGVEWQKDPYIVGLLGSLPKTGPAKAIGTAKEFEDPNTKARYYGQQYQRPDGTTFVERLDGVPAPNSSATGVKLGQQSVTLDAAEANILSGMGSYLKEDGTPFTADDIRAVKGNPATSGMQLYFTKGGRYGTTWELRNPNQVVTNVGGNVIVGAPNTRSQGAGGANTVLGAQAGGSVTTESVNPDGTINRTRTPVRGRVAGGGTTPPPANDPRPIAGTGGGATDSRDMEIAKTYFRSINGGQKLNARQSSIGIIAPQFIQRMTGMNSTEFSDAENRIKLDRDAITKTTKQRNLLEPLSRRIDAHGALLVDAMKKNGLSSSMGLNQLTNWAKSHTQEFEALKQAQLAAAAVGREYATLLQGNLGSSNPLTVRAQNAAEHLINESTPIGTVIAAIEQIKREAKQSDVALAETVSAFEKSIKDNPITKFVDGSRAAGPGRGAQQSSGMVAIQVTTPDGKTSTRKVPADKADAYRNDVNKMPGHSAK